MTNEGFIDPLSAGELGGVGLNGIGEKSLAAHPGSSRLVPGALFFSARGTTQIIDREGLHLEPAAGEPVAWASYRLVLGSGSPALISTDVNLPLGGRYWLGISDYSHSRWQWFGPFRDGRLQLLVPQPPESYRSPLGSTYLVLLTDTEEGIDVVAVSTELDRPDDTQPPPQPQGLAAVAVPGGVLLSWDPVGAEDLAGYRVYFANQPFNSFQGAEGSSGMALLGRTEFLFKVPAGRDPAATYYFRVVAVDRTGNTSSFSSMASAVPLQSTEPVEGVLSVDRVAGPRHTTVNLAVSAPAGYLVDWDTDGDGIYENLASPLQVRQVTYDNTGLWRPAVRVRDENGAVRFTSAVSMMITSNQRPLVIVTASPSTGDAPLEVSITAEASDEDGTVVELRWDYEADGAVDETTPTPGPSETKSHTYQQGLWNVRVLAEDDEGALGVGTAAVLSLGPDVGGVNQPPHAIPTAWPVSGIYYAGDTGTPPLSLSAEDSFDPEGGALEFAWDPEGDGSYTTFSNSPSFDAIYQTPGIFTPRVRVRDPLNLIDQAGFPTTLTVHKFFTHTVAGEGPSTAGLYTSLIELDGRPALTYYDETEQALKFARAIVADPLTQSDWRIHTVDQGTNLDLGEFSSLILYGGRPAVCYMEDNNGDVRFARAQVAMPEQSSDWQIHTVEATGDVGWYCSLGVSQGKPVMAYQEATGPVLRFARAQVAEPTSSNDWLIHTVDTDGEVGYYTSLVVVDGYPMIAYYDQAGGRLKFALANTRTPSTSADWTIYTIDGLGSQDAGRFAAMTLVGGRPFVVYRNLTSNSLRFARALTPLPSAPDQWVLGAVDNTSFAGEFNSVAELNGKPIVAYYNSSDQSLHFAWAKTLLPQLLSDWYRVTVTGSGMGQHTSLAVIGGMPSISHLATTNFSLRFSQALPYAPSP